MGERGREDWRGDGVWMDSGVVRRYFHPSIHSILRLPNKRREHVVPGGEFQGAARDQILRLRAICFS